MTKKHGPGESDTPQDHPSPLAPKGGCTPLLFRRTPALCALWEDHLAALLPALGIWRGQMLALNPLSSISEDFAAQTFGVLYLLIHCWIIRVNISRDNFREEETTPGHSFASN